VGLTNVAAVSVGRSHGCALITDGTMRCWGLNASGQLGDNSTTTRLTAVVVVPVTGGGGLQNIAEIAAGHDHTCARLASGSQLCWGLNDQGQLGNNTIANQSRPVTVSSLTQIKTIAAGGKHSCAAPDAEATQCWGDNSQGQLGDDSTTDRRVPTPVLLTCP
jgi:alpha-tubulin suppressor-like RCC1 family protein